MELNRINAGDVRNKVEEHGTVMNVAMSTPLNSASQSRNLPVDNINSDKNQPVESKVSKNDPSKTTSYTQQNENLIPVPQRISSKRLNLPNVRDTNLNNPPFKDRVFDAKSTGNNLITHVGWSLDGSELPTNQMVLTKSTSSSSNQNSSTKIDDRIGWNFDDAGLLKNASDLNESSNLITKGNYPENNDDRIGWNVEGAESSKNWVLQSDKRQKSPPIILSPLLIGDPSKNINSNDTVIDFDNPSFKSTPEETINQGDIKSLGWDKLIRQSSISTQPETRKESLVSLKKSISSNNSTSEAGHLAPADKSTMYCNPKNASSKVKLNLLLDSVTDRMSSNVGLSQFPLSLSSNSLSEPCDAVDGAMCSKASRNRITERLNSDLISAVFYSKPAEELKKLLQNGAEVHTKCRDSGASLLHVAALNADAGTVELLISLGCDVKARDKGGKQAVHVAAWEGALQVIQVLCKADDKMVASKVEPETPYINHYPDSWNHKHEQINKYWNAMEVIAKGSTPLHVACRRTKESCVKFLLDAGAEPEEDSNSLYPVDVIGMDIGVDPANRTNSDHSEGSLVGIAKLLIGHQKRNSGVTDKRDQKRGWPRVRRLFSVEDHDKRPVTALHTAVSDNNLNLITILLDEGADVLVWNEGGATPLHLAVKKKFLEALCLMLQHGDNRERKVVNAVDMRERTLLHLAVDEEWNDGISILLEENADITRKNFRRETVLHLAAANGNLKILTELLTVPNVSAIINGVNDDCYSPIHKAVENNHQKSMELLINNGAKADSVLPDGRTLLHICAKNNAENLMKYLLDSNQVGKIKENTTSIGDGGMTALHVAACSGHSNIVEMLLNYGCSLDAKTKGGAGSTPLHLAAKFDHIQVVQVILDFDQTGTVLEAKDAHGWYPLHIAAGHGHEECVDMLLRAGADIALPVEDEQGTMFTGLDIIMTCVHRPVDFLVKILDSYIIVDSKVPVTNPQCKIEVDFEFLLPSPSQGSELNDGGKQLRVLEAVLNNGSEDLEEAIFLHPIVQTFIYLKSKNMFLFFALFFDLFFLLALYLSVMAYHGAETLQQPLYRYILIGLLSVNMLFEIINIVRLKRYYRKDPETWIKWIVYANILVIVIHPTELVLRYNMAVSILLSWTELLLIIAKYPVWGIYVLMFATVAATILKVLVVFSLMLVGFAFTFRALFQEKGPFKTVWSSIVKVIIMVYELDYRGTMEETENEGLLFAEISRIFYLLFVVMVSMSLVNLMLGLAVSDIADLKRKGRAKRLAKQVAFLGGLENLLYCWPLSCLPLMRRYREAPRCLVVKAGTKLSGVGDSPVPKKLKESIIDKARSVQQANQSPLCQRVQTSLDAKLKEDNGSIATRKSLSASRNQIYLER